MAETKPKTAAKSASKKPAAPAKKAPAKPAAKSGARIHITQTGSPIGRQAYQRQTLIGLGLNKLHKTSELEDTPSVRGMIDAVRHLLKIEGTQQ